MLFNSGNPSLLGQARLLADDPSGAANPMWTDQQVKDQINTTYVELADLVRLPGHGSTRKRAYADGTATTAPEHMFYSLPDDFVGRLRVEISTSGADLSTTLPGSNANIKILEPTGYDVALDHYNINSGGTSDIKYSFIHGEHWGVSTPLTATEAGTKSIRITYDASQALLSGDTDEPNIPRPHHNAIALGAAVLLRMSRDLPVADLERRFELAKIALRRATTEQLDDDWGQIRIAGLTRGFSRVSNVGKARNG